MPKVRREKYTAGQYHAKNWCFTTFQDSYPAFKEAQMRYLVCQREKCPETGKEHYQGFVSFKEQKTLPQCKELLADATAHCEPSRNVRGAIDYCKKLETRVAGPWEFGRISDVLVRGHRSDLDDIKAMLDEKKPELEIAKSHFSQWCQYRRSFAAYRELLAVPRCRKTRVICLYGPTAVGKSRWAANWDKNSFWMSRFNGNNIWWDGYNGQRTVVLDEYYGWLKYDYFLRLCDRYEFRIEWKGTVMQFTSDNIVITSNVHPDEWYRCIVDPPAYKRRFDHIFHVTCEEELPGMLTP